MKKKPCADQQLSTCIMTLCVFKIHTHLNARITRTHTNRVCAFVVVSLLYSNMFGALRYYF